MSSEYEFEGRRNKLPLIAAAMAGALICGGGLAYGYKTLVMANFYRTTLEERVDFLTNSLRSAAAAISEVEREIAYRKQLVEKLKSDAQTAEQLRSLNRDQVDAIAQTLEGQLRKRDDDTWWSQVWLNVFYAVLGGAVGQFPWFIALWRRRLRLQRY